MQYQVTFSFWFLVKLLALHVLLLWYLPVHIDCYCYTLLEKKVIVAAKINFVAAIIVITIS
jgi:hypothetical protein